MRIFDRKPKRSHSNFRAKYPCSYHSFMKEPNQVRFYRVSIKNSFTESPYNSFGGIGLWQSKIDIQRWI